MLSIFVGLVKSTLNSLLVKPKKASCLWYNLTSCFIVKRAMILKVGKIWSIDSCKAISHGQSFLSYTTQEYFTHDTISLFLEESNKEMPLVEPRAPREPKSRPPTIREFHAHQSLLWIYSHPRFLWSISFDSLIISHQLPTKCWIMTNIMRGPNYYVSIMVWNG